MQNPKNKPAIRFKGFTDAWEQRLLKELADIVGGGTPSTAYESYWGGDINWFTPVEIGEEIFLTSSKRKISVSGLQNSSAKILPRGSVLFTSRAGIGKTAILAAEACTNQGFQSIVPKSEILDTYFIYSRTPELKSFGEKKGAGSTFAEVSGKQMSEMPLLMPTKTNEQKNIGFFFRQFDRLITLHQRKYEKLQNLKNAFLERMFPVNGEKFPRIRFVGFTDAWEQRQFKTFAGRSAVWDLSSKECPCIEYQNIEAGTGNLKKDFSSNNAIKLGQKFSKGDIVFGKLRPYLKNWFYAEFSGVAVGDFWIFSPKEVDSYFLYALIQGKDFLLATNQSVGSKMPRADWKLIASRPFRLPTNRAQQRRIGSLFIQLEHLITLHQRKLTKLQNVKKALLEKMFV